MLAGLLKAPSTYAPTANLEKAQARANLIVGLMQQQGYLTRAEADAARAECRLHALDTGDGAVVVAGHAGDHRDAAVAPVHHQVRHGAGRRLVVDAPSPLQL